MYKLLHIHNTITFVWDTNKFVTHKFKNEVLFIGASSDYNVKKLNELGYGYRIIPGTHNDVDAMRDYVNKFDGIIFYNLNDFAVQILSMLRPGVKTFLRFFGYELYSIKAEHYLSNKTLRYYDNSKRSILSKLYSAYLLVGRKLKILLGKEYHVKSDNQRKVYKKLNAVLMINGEEYNELSGFFYLPKLIELQFTNHEKEHHELKSQFPKLNKIIVGNSGGRWNNHFEILELIEQSQNKNNIEFHLFFSYENESPYSQEVKRSANRLKNVFLVEQFLDKEKFESIYYSSAALIINSYRQHAVGNIITAIKFGCKIYLDKRSSTYRWLRSKNFLVSQISDLENDIGRGDIALTPAQQLHNFNCFLGVMKNYSLNDFLENVEAVLKE